MAIADPRPARTCECGNHAFAPATRSKVVLVSPEDRDLLSGHYWCAHKKGYIQSQGVRLHRAVVNAPDGILVDHKNHDKADCRRTNLRLATDAQSVRNRKKLRRNSTPSSPYIGVYRNGGGWTAKISVNGVRQYLGTFRDDRDAAQAYDAAASTYVGEFARLNFSIGG